MELALFSRRSLSTRIQSTSTHPKTFKRSFRPSLENLESRWTPAVIGLPIDVTEVRLNDAGQLEAVVELAGQATDVIPLTASTEAPPEGEDCPILNLELGEINLNLLGLHVDTSEICLDVTATDDQGLLGGLLCDLTGALDLTGILGQLDDVVGGVDQFLDTIETLLDDVLARTMTVTDVLGTSLEAGGVDVAQADVCEILNLALGPVDLEVPLLGVNVYLDDCNDGPVTVDVTADPEGGLLGNLLCSVADGIDVGDLDTDALVQRVEQLIDRLTALSERLDNLPNVARNVTAQIDNLERAAGRVDDVADLDKLVASIDKVARKVDRQLARLG